MQMLETLGEPWQLYQGMAQLQGEFVSVAEDCCSFEAFVK